MDSHSFASLAHLRILLLPVGSLRQASFDNYAADIRSFDQIRLGDIPNDSRDERSRFMPKPLAEGYLHLCFLTHPPPLSHAPLSLILPSHFPLAIIGIGEASHAEPLHTIHSQFHNQLAQLFPSGALFPLAKSCFVFESGDAISSNPVDNIPGLTFIPSVMGNKKLYIGTLLADICSNVLGEFGVLVQTLESPIGNEYLNSSLLPIFPPLSDIPSSLSQSSRRDSLPPLPSVSSQPELGKPGSPFLLQPGMKRTFSAGPNRQSTLGVPAGRKRASAIGASSSDGRLFKVLGDFFLLAGRTEDALIWYNEAIILFKSSNDPIWNASALEGISTIAVLDAWSAGHGLNASMSNTKHPWIEVADKLQQAMTLYSSRFTSSDSEDYALVSYIYCCSVLRHASLLFAVWSAKGWGPLAFTAMLHPGPAPYIPPTLSSETTHSWEDLERLSIVSGIPRSSISAVLAQLHGPWLLHLGSGERLSILQSMAALYSCLGYKRKEAYILREILGCILDLIVCSREETGDPWRTSVDGRAANDVHGLGINIVQTNIQGAVGVRRNESSEGNESILRLLKYTYNALGVDLESVSIVEQVVSEKEDQNIPSSIAHDDDLENVAKDIFGWPELQVGVIREAVAVAEALPDHLAVAQFALSSLKTLHSVLDPSEQNHLYSTSGSALMTARRRGETRCIDYWSGRPVVTISVAPLSIMRMPLEKPLSALSVQLNESNVILAVEKDPFLYNPRRIAEGQGTTMAVQNERIEFTLLLQNPYCFGLELQSLTVSTTGVRFDTKPISVTIPPSTLHQVTVTGIPLEPGRLTIRGCIVRASGGASREFVLPLSTDEEEERISRSKTALACESGRFKYPGLEMLQLGRPPKRPSAQVGEKAIRLLECKVVPEQPLLRIRRTSLTHGAVMMYNGETSTIRLLLENVSHLPVDFIHLSFDDSSIGPAQQALSEGELSVFETYETEYELVHRPLLHWDGIKEPRVLHPGQKTTLEVSCYGKADCDSGTIHVSYAYIHRDTSLDASPKKVFHTRQLSYPIMVTVYKMLECYEMDILPYSVQHDLFSFHEGGNKNDRAQLRHSLKDIENERDWCLFSIEVRNVYGIPFEVSFERCQKDAPSLTITSIVAPGSTTRMILPLRRFSIPDSLVAQAIPTLSDRQFVVAKSSLSSGEESMQRLLFWHREEVLKVVKGKWREAGGTRLGDLSLRQQRLTFTMLKALRTDVVQVQISLWAYDAHGNEEEVPYNNGKYQLPSNEFIYARTMIKKLTSDRHILNLDLRCDPSQHVIHEGHLTGQPIGHLEEGNSKQLEVTLCFLAKGRYELVADVLNIDMSVGSSKVIITVG